MPPGGAGRAHKVDHDVGPCWVPDMTELCFSNISSKEDVAPTGLGATGPSPVSRVRV